MPLEMKQADYTDLGSPSDIEEYVEAVRRDPEYYDSSDGSVSQEEGTLNRSKGNFWCTDCYIKIPMPLGVAP